MIEMITGEKPYKECKGQILSVCDKIINKVLPECFHKINNERAKEFILKCLKPENERPSAAELLEDPFLNDTESEENSHPAIYFENPIHNKSSEIILLEKNNKINENILFDDFSIGEKSNFTYNVSNDNRINKLDSFSNIMENNNNINNIELLKKNLNSNTEKKEIETEIYFILNEDQEKNNLKNINSDDIYKLILVKKKGENISKFNFNYMLSTDTIQGVINELAKRIDLNNDEIKQCEKKLKIFVSELMEKEKEKNELEQQINLINNCYEIFIKEYNDNIKQIQELNQLYQEIKQNEKDYSEEEMIDIDNKMKILKQLK